MYNALNQFANYSPPFLVFVGYLWFSTQIKSNYCAWNNLSERKWHTDRSAGRYFLPLQVCQILSNLEVVLDFNRHSCFLSSPTHTPTMAHMDITCTYWIPGPESMVLTPGYTLESPGVRAFKIPQTQVATDQLNLSPGSGTRASVSFIALQVIIVCGWGWESLL